MKKLELQEYLKNLAKKTQEILPTIKLSEKENELKKWREKMNQEDFWQNPEEAQKISKRIAFLENFLKKWQGFSLEIKNLKELLEISEAKDLDDLEIEINKLSEIFAKAETEILLNGKYDENNVILEIKTGNGGQDAEDFSQMLLRMYLRFAEKNGWKTQILEESITPDGLKSAMLEIRGQFAYGLLKSEHGVHRLIRLSPFNAKNLRQTSFSRIEILPEIQQENEIEIVEKDLRIDVFRASGNGGQSVNTTDSAVRITYLPLNISVSCQNEKSQLQNKQFAIKVLKSRLLQLKLEQNIQEISEIRGNLMENSFGSQIRTFTLQPYKLVKDHRTNYEESNPEKVFDGNLNGFIQSFLRK